MGNIAIETTSDQVFDRLVSGLEAAFGRNAAEGLARHFIAAEGADFYWEARERERWLGAYESLDEEVGDRLDRVAVSGFLDGRHYVAVLLIGPSAGIDGLLGIRQFEAYDEAERAFESIC